MLLIIYEINQVLTCSANFIISYGTAANQATSFEITDTKFYVPVVTLATNDNAKLLRQLNQVLKEEME